jgi:putative transposase
VLAAAHASHPERFINKRPEPPRIPDRSWINPPEETEAAAQ